jgi:hypothetical protein
MKGNYLQKLSLKPKSTTLIKVKSQLGFNFGIHTRKKPFERFKKKKRNG